jgi:hypothetical protein
MISFGPAAVIGLCFGFMFGIGCSLAVLYSIYLGGYRKAIADSLSDTKPQRYLDALKRIRTRQAKHHQPL